jgi:hypothetical protein
MKGLEPPHLAAQEPKSCVSTNSTTSARLVLYGVAGGSLSSAKPVKKLQKYPQPFALVELKIYVAA